ncbi:insulinase family protein [Kitasatospora sp. NPDC058243]|uniref:insulinase family protein n=1 Tax=Kitasatospora sp. NPDC058243 TaxID=3346397 RepID=UPI0036DBFFF9
MIATYGLGFGHDPSHAPGVAHLYEHLYLATLRGLMTTPVVVQAQTRADTMSVSATVLSDADRELVGALAETPRLLAAGKVDEGVRMRECRAIDVELSEWFGNPLLLAGHKLAALATRRPGPARFDECRIGASSAIAMTDLRAHAARRAAALPERLVIVGPRPAEEWLALVDAVMPCGPADGPAVHTRPGDDLPGPSGDVPGADSRVFVGVPLRLGAPDDAETVQLVARLLSHGAGPLAEVGNRVGARFRGGSVVPTAGCLVVTGSWIAEDSRRREAIGVAMSQYRGRISQSLLTAQAAAVLTERRAAATTSATLATAIDGWQAGSGVNPIADVVPGMDDVKRVIRAGWERSVLVGARPARACARLF